MSRLTIVDQRLCLRFSRAEKVMGILRDLDVPLDRVVSAEPMRESWWRVVRGWQLGFSLPGVRLLGTWWRHRRRQLVDLRRRQPALHIVLRDGWPYDELLVSTPDAYGLLQQLREAGVGRHSRHLIE
jgi:hypothetical protein